MPQSIIYNPTSCTFEVITSSGVPGQGTSTLLVVATIVDRDTLVADDGTIVLVLDARGDVEVPTLSAFYVRVQIQQGDVLIPTWKWLDVCNINHVAIPSNVRVVTPAGAGDGTCWAAPSTLSAVLDAYQPGAFDEIWCVGQIYRITETLTIPEGVSLLGGFVGTETASDQRVFDSKGYPRTSTVFMSDGAAPILQCGESGASTSGNTIDAIMFSDAIATGTTTPGAGITMYGGVGSVITRCTFINNTQSDVDSTWGGAIGGENFTIRGCRFHGNMGGAGGAVHSAALSTISNSVFHSNFARIEGGAIYLNNGGKIENCVVYNNTAESGGGGISAEDADLLGLTVINNLSNQAATGGGVKTYTSGNLVNSIVVGNESGDDLDDMVLVDTPLTAVIRTGDLLDLTQWEVPNVATLGLVNPTAFVGSPITDVGIDATLAPQAATADFSPNQTSVVLGLGVHELEGVTFNLVDARGAVRSEQPAVGAYEYATGFETPILQVNGKQAGGDGSLNNELYRSHKYGTTGAIVLEPSKSMYILRLETSTSIVFGLDQVDLSKGCVFDLIVDVADTGLTIAFDPTYHIASASPDFTVPGVFIFYGQIAKGDVVLTYHGKKRAPVS